MQRRNSPLPQPITTVIFDLDDTLIDWSQQAIGWDEFLQPGAQSICRKLATLGYASPDPADFHTVFRRVLEHEWEQARETWQGVSFYVTLQQTCRELGVPLADADVASVAAAFVWEPVPGVVPFADTHDVLSDLQRKGYQLGLITNSFQPMWMRDAELEAYGLIDFFPARITSGDTGFIKPHPAIFWRMLGMLDSIPERAMYVGDHPTFDVQGANLLGLTSILYKPDYLDRDLDGHEPDYTIRTLSELPPLLETLRS